MLPADRGIWRYFNSAAESVALCFIAEIPCSTSTPEILFLDKNDYLVPINEKPSNFCLNQHLQSSYLLLSFTQNL